MIARSLRSLFSVCARRMGTGTAPVLSETGPPDVVPEFRTRRGRDWPVDHRGEEIRTAKARRLGISTSDKKLNLVAKLVRGLTIQEAERQLVGCRKKHADVLMKTIAAAVTNARHFKLREDRLVVSEAFVGKGKYLKRIRPWHGKGRFGIEHKKYAHLTVILRELDEELWEASVLPQYVHMRYSDPDKHRIDDRDHPIHKSDRVSFHSQLDVSFRDTRKRVEGLRELLKGTSVADTPTPA
eukprot:GFKZ01000819.1.p1 GENE.GFKZ01000819.1~~GFKZ01000819.1.p1  ORF type:complete len:240 (-),score=26.97 GFKZ01000819.1:1046-1765(-)